MDDYGYPVDPMERDDTAYGRAAGQAARLLAEAGDDWPVLPVIDMRPHRNGVRIRQHAI